MTTNLIALFDDALSDEHTDVQLIELVNHILSNTYRIDRESYIRKHIDPSTAADIAFADESICQEYFDINPLSPELALSNLPIKELAYHLVFTEPDKATQLLDELLYYRTKSQRI